MGNVDKSIFPTQKLPLSKKNQDWKEASLNAVIGRKGGGLTGHHSRYDTMKTSYGLYNSEYDEADLKYVTDPFKVEDGFPAKTQNFNIIRPKIDLLIGEESKRPFNIKVIQTNDDVVTQLQQEKKDLLMQYAMSVLGMQQDEQGQPLIPEEIDKYLKYSYKSIAEETAYHSLNYLKEKLNLPNEFLKGWKDGLVAGEEIYYVGSINGEPILERVNPLWCDYDKDPDLDFIEDGDWFVREMQMSPSSIYDRFFDIMDESDLDKMLDYSEGHITVGKPSEVNIKSIMYKENVTSRFFDDSRERSINLLNVWHGVWRSYKKIGFLTFEDESGERQTTIVDETYIIEKDNIDNRFNKEPYRNEKIEWNWVPEVWEGYRIGEDIYVGVGPVDYQHVSIDNPSNRKLPYCGVIYSNVNSKSKSLTAIMKPLQYMYIILWYRLELELARDKGKVINMDITQIPKGLGIDVNQWMHYLSALGVNFFNPYDEGWDIPGREGGKPSSFNQFSQIDLSMTNIIAGYIDLMSKIEEMIGEISGVSKQRQGSIETRELVGNVERAVIQSSHITEPLFWNHNQAKKNALTMLLNTAKYVWENTSNKSVHYMLNDTSRMFFEINEDFLYSDFDVFLSDSTKETRDIESIKTLLQPAMQGGASLLEAAEILSSDNVTQIKNKLAEVEKKKEEMMAQQAQAEQQQVELEIQLKVEENRIKEEDSIRRSETQIVIAQIKAASVEGDGEENEDSSEAEKLRLQNKKQESDSKVKRDQLMEDIRKNKVAEKQKQEEISIKRTQAKNKPNKTK